jgi:hypothetical protein
MSAAVKAGTAVAKAGGGSSPLNKVVAGTLGLYAADQFVTQKKQQGSGGLGGGGGKMGGGKKKQQNMSMILCLSCGGFCVFLILLMGLLF